VLISTGAPARTDDAQQCGGRVDRRPDRDRGGHVAEHVPLDLALRHVGRRGEQAPPRLCIAAERTVEEVQSAGVRPSRRAASSSRREAPSISQVEVAAALVQCPRPIR